MQNPLPQRRPSMPANVPEIIGWVASGIPGLLIVFLAVIALLLPVFYSFTDMNMLEAPKLIGFDNYHTLFTSDAVFATALGNSAIDLLVIGIGGFLLCLMIALLLRSLPQVLRYVPVAALFVPLICPGMVSLVSVLFSGDAYGYVNALLMNAGVTEEPILFLTTPEIAPHIVRVVQLWRSLGPGVLIISAGLDSVRPAVLKESRQRGVTGHFPVFVDITLPRMRMPLMLAAVVMVMAAMGTSKISTQLAGLPSVEYCAHTLWMHILDYSFMRYEMGYAAAVVCVTHAIELLAMLLLCGLIFLLTWRPSRAAYARVPAPPERVGLSDKWDGWRILWAAVGAAVTLLICVLPVFMLVVEINMSLKPMDELFAYPPHLLVNEATLDNFSYMYDIWVNSEVSAWSESLHAVLYALLPMLPSMVILGVIGYGLSRRRSQVVRVLLAAILSLLVLCSPFADYLRMFTGSSYTEYVEFTETLPWLCWVFVPASAAMGLSFGEMCRRKWPVPRVLAAAAGYACLVLFFCWNGSMGRYIGYLATGGIALAGMAAAGNVIVDLPILLLNIPIVAGLFQLLTGLGNTHSLYLGGNE